jgi:ABC-type bacteriocin/lantibiotic exporter with double-glycine peptidase domain
LIYSLNLSISKQFFEKSIQKIEIEHLGFKSEVEVNDLSFKYQKSDNFAIRDINLKLLSGMQVALVGPSGAGKSTLVDLLLGLHHPSTGEVEISGISAADAIEKWPGAVAYVPQEIYLVSGSISDNVLLGFSNNDENKAAVVRALQMAELSEYLDQEGNVIELNIGDEGGKMSGGQRQRIGIARALLTNPKILILDEATSSLDAQTENSVTSTINKIRGDSLVVVVAHRLATVRQADLVIYMQNGQIAAQGSFDEVRQSIPDFDAQAQLMGL